jgi:probable phosphoglycerate mutase
MLSFGYRSVNLKEAFTMTLTGTTTFLVIRHGETCWNAEKRVQGFGDSPLTATGRAQVRSLARRLTGIAFDALISSDLGRARETASLIADATGHCIQTDRRLRERNYGILEGLTEQEISDRFPEALDRLRASDPDYVVPQGESYRQHCTRCIASMETMAEEKTGATLVVVAHGGVLDVLFRFVTRMGHRAPACFATANASLNTISCAHLNESRQWVIETWGDVAHISG